MLQPTFFCVSYMKEIGSRMGVKELIIWTFGTFDTPDSQKFVEDVYNKYKLLMFSIARKYTSNASDQEDIVQTVLERLLKKGSTAGTSKCDISASYIICTVRSVSIDFLRKQGREAEHCVSIEDEHLAERLKTDETLDELLLDLEDAKILNDIWPQLLPAERLLLEGKYILGLTDQELAVILKCKSSSIRMKLTRARRRAAKLVSERKSK